MFITLSALPLSVAGAVCIWFSDTLEHLTDLFVTMSLGELAPAAAGSGGLLVSLRWRVSSMENMSDLKLPYFL